MSSSDHGDTFQSSAAGIGERLSQSNSGVGIINVLADLGPASTQSTTKLRDVLREITRNIPSSSTSNGNTNISMSSFPLNEEAIAYIIFFFSDRGTQKRVKGSNGTNSDNTSSTMVGTLTNDHDTSDESQWNLEVVSQVIAKDYAQLDWALVARNFDFPDFHLRDSAHLKAFLHLYQSGAGISLPLKYMSTEWENKSGQLSFFETALTSSPTVYKFSLNEEETADANTAGDVAVAASPNPQGWASTTVLSILLELSDMPTYSRRVRDLFVKGLLSCPEVLICAFVRRLQATASQQGGNNSRGFATHGMQLKGELMRELIPLFFKPNPHYRVQNGPGAIRRLWSIAPNTVSAACFEAYRSTVNDPSINRLGVVIHIISITRLLPSPETAQASILNTSKDSDFSIAVAFVMADNELLQLRPWLVEKATGVGFVFFVGLIAFIGRNYTSALPRMTSTNNNDGKGASLLSIENMITAIRFLQSLDASVMSKEISTSNDGSKPQTTKTLGDSLKALIEVCIATHPSLATHIAPTDFGTTANPASAPGNTPTQGGASDDIEEMANSYFQKIYTSEQSIDEVVDMLKRFKTSGTQRENDIFACMIHNLFDEYRFFSKYPEKELRITGILFGKLIQHQLVSSITLGIALRYVLEALRKPPSGPVTATTSNSGKMFRFGMFALEQFKERLHEWPQYCSHIVQIPHLKEGYAALVAEIEGAMVENQNKSSSGGSVGGTASDMNSVSSDRSGSRTAGSKSNNTSAGVPTSVDVRIITQVNPPSESGSTPQPNGAPVISSNFSLPPVDTSSQLKKRTVAIFGPGLGRAVNNKSEEVFHEAPPDAILDRVQFLINNVTMSNVEQKSQELRDTLSSQHFGWLGQYLVVKRISTQPNFHSVYLAFLEQLGDYGRGLVDAILSSVYLNVGKLLRSPKITTSSSERSLLKNLGSWLGQITLARNKPILQITLDCKELLFQGYETGMLIAVTPFVAKILEGAKNSVVFRPPNPWLMGLLSVFRALYGVEDLKMNIKFEVEVLCKNLGVKLEDIPLRTEDLAKRLSPVKTRNPDFNTKSSMSNQGATPAPSVGTSTTPTPATEAKQSASSLGSVLSTSTLQAVSSSSPAPYNADQQQTVIPNLASYVTINPSLASLFQQLTSTGVSSTVNNAALKKSVPIAVDRAIREIIQPVVERSVSIACITAKEIVTKDFAMESDENKMRKAAQLMVANLAGSLALVTCREPLRVSVSTHLRQLLTSNGSNDGGKLQLSEQEQNVIDQCVSICSQDNLELGCMLIEKAATEKAVRDMDEALAPALNTRKKHREQTGQPFYDMSIFGPGNQRYPSSLPEPIRPKPGGLRNDQLLVYEAFQRISRQPNTTTPPQQGASTGGTNTPSEGINSKTGSKLNVEALSVIAMKLDNAVTSLLAAAGSRAQEVVLRMIPPDHEIKQLLTASQQLTSSAATSGRLSTAETDVVLGFAQGIFKRLYELRLSEPLRLEVFVALLSSLNDCCRQLDQDLSTWATYAPTETEGQRKLHRTVLLLLLRSKLFKLSELDEYLSRNMDGGRNIVWLEFTLVILRSALVEKIVNPSDLPKIVNMFHQLSKATSQNSQVNQLLRLIQEINGMNVDTKGRATPDNVSATVSGLNALVGKPDKPTHQQSSSISSTSLNNLAEATKRADESIKALSRDDPPGLKQQVMVLLEGWLRINSELGSNERKMQFLQLLQQNGIGKNEEHTERFFRISTEILIASSFKTAATSDTSSKAQKLKPLNYTAIDGYCKLLSLLVKHLHSGGTGDQIATQRVSILNKILGITVRTMMAHYERSKTSADGVSTNWDQRPWFRILLNLVIDLNTPSQALDPISYGVLSVFGSAFHVIQPLVIPGFAFAWLELVSHRMFLSNLLLVNGQKGWPLAHQLLIDLFLFLEPHLRKVELTDAVRHLYKGSLRVLLVLLHDFPSFLAGYHLSFCNVIPENCVQLRNLVLSAFPRGMVLPDPFTPNLKIDLLPEMNKSPPVLSNVSGPLSGLRAELDNFINNRQSPEFLHGLLPRLCKEGTNEIDAARVNALVLYVGMQAIATMQSSQTSQVLARTPEMEIMHKLMDFNDRGRYISLNAIANQLRYPSSHTHYFSCVMLFLFSDAKNEGVREQVTRVLLERLIVHRPHPWGLLITFIELIKNQRYQFWNHPFTRCATEIEKVFESVARSCMTPGSQMSTHVGGSDSQ